jgi:uracil-DNA glycosylase
LSVRAHEALSHADFGWQAVTNAVVRAVNALPRRVVFVLWGNNAAAYAKFIDAARPPIIASAHPSPLSARRGFFGSRPFSRANAALAEAGIEPIDWSL